MRHRLFARLAFLAVAASRAFAFTSIGTQGRAERSSTTFRVGDPRSSRRRPPNSHAPSLAATAANETAAAPPCEVEDFSRSRGTRLRPEDVALSVRKECTHILILPGFATATEDYTRPGSLAPNLVGRGGWRPECIHVLPVRRSDWLLAWRHGLFDPDFVSALVGVRGSKGAPPDRMPYRWYLKRVATAIRDIDAAVKSEVGPSRDARVILIGHSAGGWLARAAAGFGHEHRTNATSLDAELGIDMEKVLAIITLGTPHATPPDGSVDVTGGAVRITNERFPGSYFEDKAFYVTAASGGCSDALSRQSYEMVAGRSCRDGDGIVPVDAAHLEGATQIHLDGVRHAAAPAGLDGAPSTTWYGSDDVVDRWFDAVLENLRYIQEADEALLPGPAAGTEDGAREAPVATDEEGARAAVATEGGGADARRPPDPPPNNDPPPPSAAAPVEDYFRRRNALRYSGIFDGIPDRRAYEGLVYSMEDLALPAGSRLIVQGDESDSMFFVRSGELECYDERTGEVKAVVGKNAVVGELGVLLGDRRALSVRAGTDAAVYRLSKEDNDKYVLREETGKEASLLLDKDVYGEHFARRSKREALRACPLFKELEERDTESLVKSMKRVDVRNGERIIEEGAQGGTMYIVEDGCFACYRESNKQVVKVCERHDYFGELGVIFKKPRAVSVCATKPSTVWELQGESFLQAYQKMILARAGGSSWVLLLGKLLRAEKWMGKLVPKPLSRAFLKMRFAVLEWIDLYKLTGRHFEDNRWSGTKAHLICALASVAIPLFIRCSGSALAGGSSELTKSIMTMSFAGLVFDNLVNASGKYLGEGNRMRHLCKVCNILHGMTIPLLYVPLVEIAMKSGLVSAKVSRAIMTAFVAFGLYEAIDWLAFDVNDMVLVDNRDSKRNTPRSIAGTLRYSSGKVLKNVIPVAALQLFVLGVGSALWARGAPGGGWLFAAGTFALLSCSVQQPDIQALGEATMVGLLWQAAGAAQKGLV